MHYIDVFFLVILFVVHPVYGAVSTRKVLAAAAAGGLLDRPMYMRQTIITQWIALIVLGIVWYGLSRDISVLGIKAMTGTEVLIGLAGLVLVTVVTGAGWRQARNLSTGEKVEQREEAGDFLQLMPQTAGELRWGYALSVTAGIVEEVIFRGYVLWLFTGYMPVWVAAVVSSIGFGLVHSYQGVAGMAKVFLVGFAFATLYILTGSIWFPIAAHILFDVIQLSTVREMFINREATAAN